MSTCAQSGCSTPSAKSAGAGLRLGIGVLVVGQSMVFGLALNLHDDVPPAARALTQWLILAGTGVVAALLGGPLVRTAWTELRRGRLTIEALFLLTMTGALAASLQAHLTDRGKIYFEVVSVLLVVYTLGKLIGARSREAALAASRPWADQLSTCRLVDESGGTRTAPVAEVRPGDVVVWDDLQAQKNPAVVAAIEAVGARVEPLPTYSPDLSPIEEMFSKTKAYLRTAEARTTNTVITALGQVLDRVTPSNIRGWFHDRCAYAIPE